MFHPQAMVKVTDLFHNLEIKGRFLPTICIFTEQALLKYLSIIIYQENTS